MQNARQIFLKKDFVFIASYIIFRLLFEGQLRFFVSLSGAPVEYLQDVVQDNELVLQVVSMAAVFVVVYWKEINSPGILGRLTGPAFWEKLYRTKIAHIEWGVVCQAAFKGFLVVSLAVGGAVLLGAGQIEGGVLKLDSILGLLPYLYSELFLLAIWVVFLEMGRSLFWRSVVQCQSDKVASTWGTLMVVGWETWVLFQVLNGSPFVKDQVVTGLFCATIAGAQLLWMQMGDSSLSERMRRNARVFRLSFLFAVFVSYFHIYGQPFGYSRQVSLYNFVNSPISDIGSFAERGPSGQAVSLLLVALLVNALLQGALNKNPGTK